jgi:hypothetical protein
MGKPLMKVSSNSWIKGFKKANKTFVSSFLTSLSELAGMQRIGIGPNYEAFPVFNNTISSVQQSRCLVLAL